MSAIRVLVLGLLASDGPMHGHQLRRHIDLFNLEAWGDVRAGALYGALHRMEDDGLIVPLRNERSGRFPPRTVYAITDEGRLELGALRDRALQEARLAPDPFDVALTVAGLPAAALAPLLEQRRGSLRADLDRSVSEHERLRAAGILPVAHHAVFVHWEMRLRAELDFLDQLAPLLPALADERPGAHTEPSKRAEATGQPGERS